ncbi:hypothetical protein ACPPVQ_19055 [Diaminobutyricibacter sp. McL0618]|uniref:hypothetical protein n=1 Tax=Leifsonia sp. McL0618 TaxID=3415677 RepID=UPI003CE98200
MERRKYNTGFALLGAGALLLAAALSGCSAAAAGDPPASAPTPTVTVTMTATPAPSTPSPDDPIDAATAWAACAVLGQAEYINQTPGSTLRPYDPKQPPTKNADGSWSVTVSMAPPPGTHDGFASIVALCDIKGTLGAPTLIRWTLKDI